MSSIFFKRLRDSVSFSRFNKEFYFTILNETSVSLHATL